MAEPGWWDPVRYAARRPNLAVRAEIVAAIRRHFAAAGFVEVETPCLQPAPGAEPALDAFSTELREPFDDGGGREIHLHASPEFAMKKLVAAGEKRLFQIARCFRNGERSATHHPEFTMLEWYRAGAGYLDAMAECESLVAGCARTLRRGGRTAETGAPWTRISVAEAFNRHAGIDLLAAMDDGRAPTPRPLIEAARRVGVRADDGDSWEDAFFRVFLDKVEPHLGFGAPAILYDYPAPLAALARLRPGGRLAERFEVFACGLELANGYGELTDPAEHRARFARARARRRELGRGAAWPVDEEFMAALEAGLPDCAGVALGLDRLAMLAVGADDIEDVLWAPVARAGPG